MYHAARRASQPNPHPFQSSQSANMTAFSADEFRKACGVWASGVSIVTTRDPEGQPYGLTMNAVTSLSLDPPLFVICVDNKSDTLAAIKRSGVFAINILAQPQQALSNAFAKKNPDKFAAVSFEWGKSGAPLLTGRLLGIECRVRAAYPEGDHQIFVGAVTHLTPTADPDAAPLLYYRGRYAELLGPG
ncbi:MAG: flavin reductase [Gammaproteobacteria bacterium]|nr:flavin reductase [Gammaproteobacteria bacterium]